MKRRENRKYHWVFTKKKEYTENRSKSKRYSKEVLEDSKRMKSNRKRTDWIAIEHKREADRIEQ